MTCSSPPLEAQWTSETIRLLWGWEFDLKGPSALKVMRLSPSVFPFQFAGCCFRVLPGWCWCRCRSEDPLWQRNWQCMDGNLAMVDIRPPPNSGVWAGELPVPEADVLLKPWALPSSPSLSAPWNAPNTTFSVPPGPNFSRAPALCHFSLRLVMGYNMMWCVGIGLCSSATSWNSCC